jgi:hypothetical protein
MRAFLLFLSSLPLLLLFGACTESTEALPDSGITFTPPDASADTGASSIDASTADAVMSSMGDIGQTCGSDTDCNEFCATEGDGFRDGYCSQVCDETLPCPTGSACVQVTRDQSWCLDECDAGADTRDCRAGYGCAVSVTLPAPLCIPGCTDDTDCPTGNVCNPSNGGSCYDPDAEWGDPCTGASECPDGAFCFGESFRGWPGGMCIAFGCDPASTTGGGCPTDTVCIPGGRSGFGRCIPTCETGDDCRDAYDCLDDATYPGRLSCQPACETNSQCTGSRVCTEEGLCE